MDEIPSVAGTPANSNPNTDVVNAIRGQVRQVIVGQEEIVEQVLMAFLAAGHVVLEGLPGLGKTLLVRALAQTFGGQTRRVQFTPDLMPSDITGHVMFDVKSGDFHVRKGPIFTNLLLADEINRAPAKTQSAMLEVMQEGQVTLEGESHKLTPPFMVLATQNPWELEGTYPLPEAQLDRFLFKIHIDYPSEETEEQLVHRVTVGRTGGDFDLSGSQPVVTASQVLELQEGVARTTVDARVSAYAVAIVRATRNWPGLALGAGPRGGISLVRAAKARALMAGRDFVTPDDVKIVALPALRHRVQLSPEGQLEGRTADDVLRELFMSVEPPRK